MKEKRYPVGWYPANEEEAVARIEAIEAEYERTGKATDFEEFIEELKAEGLWLIPLLSRLEIIGPEKAWI